VSDKPYNPLDTRHLGASVAEALLERLPQPLGQLHPFSGAGIYAIYYTGDFPLYAPIAAANNDDQWRWPIYVGKAVPSGARKGGIGAATGRWLFNRLREHAESVSAAENLDLADFRCRYLVVEDIWIPLGESLLIAKFTPLWNRMIDGFGNHDPGAGRYMGARPRWDVLHPGRGWAAKCQPRAEVAEIVYSEIEAHLRTAPVPPARPRMLLDE
jgi:hypothetical protein